MLAFPPGRVHKCLPTFCDGHWGGSLLPTCLSCKSSNFSLEPCLPLVAATMALNPFMQGSLRKPSVITVITETCLTARGKRKAGNVSNKSSSLGRAGMEQTDTCLLVALGPLEEKKNKQDEVPKKGVPVYHVASFERNPMTTLMRQLLLWP